LFFRFQKPKFVLFVCFFGDEKPKFGCFMYFVLFFVDEKANVLT